MDQQRPTKFEILVGTLNGWFPAVYMGGMSQNFRLLHVSDLSVLNLRFFSAHVSGVKTLDFRGRRGKFGCSAVWDKQVYLPTDHMFATVCSHHWMAPVARLYVNSILNLHNTYMQLMVHL